VDAYENGQDFAIVTRSQQNNDTQKWVLSPVSVFYTIQQLSNGRFVDAHDNSEQDFRLVTGPDQNNDTQKWILTHLGESIFTIQQLSNGRFVDRPLKVEFNDSFLVTRPANDSNFQRWLIESAFPIV
jgi:hypothetical protein